MTVDLDSPVGGYIQIHNLPDLDLCAQTSANHIPVLFHYADHTGPDGS
jgi:hypothetical protein